VLLLLPSRRILLAPRGQLPAHDGPVVRARPQRRGASVCRQRGGAAHVVRRGGAVRGARRPQRRTQHARRLYSRHRPAACSSPTRTTPEGGECAAVAQQLQSPKTCSRPIAHCALRTCSPPMLLARYDSARPASGRRRPQKPLPSRRAAPHTPTTRRMAIPAWQTAYANHPVACLSWYHLAVGEGPSKPYMSGRQLANPPHRLRTAPECPHDSRGFCAALQHAVEPMQCTPDPFTKTHQRPDQSGRGDGR
jgi:hypothetical protein